MGFIDKMFGSIRNFDDDEEFDDEYGEYDGDYDDEPRRSPGRRSLKSATMEDDDFYNEPKRPAKPAAMPRNGKNRIMSNGMEVCVIKPTTFEESIEITDTLLDNRTVLLNMEGLDIDLAQRIIDFTSGSTYAISGNLQKISNYIFILTPHNVDVSGDFQEMLFAGSFDVPALNNKF